MSASPTRPHRRLFRAFVIGVVAQITLLVTAVAINLVTEDWRNPLPYAIAAGAAVVAGLLSLIPTERHLPPHLPPTLPPAAHQAGLPVPAQASPVLAGPTSTAVLALAATVFVLLALGSCGGIGYLVLTRPGASGSGSAAGANSATTTRGPDTAITAGAAGATTAGGAGSGNRLIAPVSVRVDGITMTAESVAVTSTQTFVTFVMDDPLSGDYTIGGGSCNITDNYGNIWLDSRDPIQPIRFSASTRFTASYEFVLDDSAITIEFECITPGPRWTVTLHLRPGSG